MILKHELYSHELHRKVRIHLRLPDDYLNMTKAYPVLYMFDGHNLFFDEDATFGRSWRLLDHLPDDLIVAGIECSHQGNERLVEYAPFPFYDPEYSGSFDAKGAKTMQFIISRLKPYIDRHFPTLPDRDHTWIAGSSCGGIMALYALLGYSYIFSKAAALSPYILVSQSSLLYYASKSMPHYDSSLYLSWGAREGNGAHEFVAETKVLTDLSNILLPKGVKIEYNVRPFGEHCEAEWESQADSFLKFFFS